MEAGKLLAWAGFTACLWLVGRDPAPVAARAPTPDAQPVRSAKVPPCPPCGDAAVPRRPPVASPWAAGGLPGPSARPTPAPRPTG